MLTPSMEQQLLITKKMMIDERFFLSQGGNGKVYRTNDQKTGELIAVKELIVDPNYKYIDQAFQNEISTMQNLKHINIVRLIGHESVPKEKTYIIKMEYCNGSTLYKNPIYKEYDPSMKMDLLDIIVQTFLALDYIHNLHYFHGDIKPENILFQNNLVKICDFGLAHKLNKDNPKINGGKGTLPYNSLSVLEGKKHGTERDVWSMGVIIYEICEKRHPFNSKTPQLLQESIKKSQLIFKHTQDSELKWLIQAMLGQDFQKWTFYKLLKQDFLIERLKLYYVNMIISHSQPNTQIHPSAIEHINKRYEKTLAQIEAILDMKNPRVQHQLTQQSQNLPSQLNAPLKETTQDKAHVKEVNNASIQCQLTEFVEQATLTNPTANKSLTKQTIQVQIQNEEPTNSERLMKPPKQYTKINKDNRIQADKVIKSTKNDVDITRRRDVRMKQGMIDEPLKLIDLFINLKIRKFTKNSEQLLIGIYAFDKYLKDYKPPDGSKYKCPVKDCPKIEDHFSHLRYHVRQHIVTNDSQLRNQYYPKQSKKTDNKQRADYIEQPTVCQYCNQIKTNLSNHMLNSKCSIKNGTLSMWTIYEELKGSRSFKIMLLEQEEEINAKQSTRVTIKCKDKKTKSKDLKQETNPIDLLKDSQKEQIILMDYKAQENTKKRLGKNK